MQATTHTVLRTLFCILIAASAVLAVETWQLVDKDIPVLPQVITSNEYRGFQRFIKLRRIKEREVAYIRVDQSTGMQWISIFEWDVPVQPTVTTGQEIKIKTRARMDRKIGQHGSVGRISVAADRRYDTNVIRHADGLADPDGTFGGPEAEARFQVTERPDYPNSDEIRLSVFISDGGVTGERVATYIYKRASGTTPGPEPGKACGYTLGASMLSKWQSLGGAQSVLGCPTMNETVAGRSPQGTNGTYALFQYGTICTPVSYTHLTLPTN